MAVNNQEQILLESGTNELEVLEFVIAGNSFGINVAKIRSLLQDQVIHPMPRSHPFVEGIIKPRDKPLTVIALDQYLGLERSGNPEKDILIIAGFNKMDVVFRVHAVENIHRISWETIEKPDRTIYGGEEGIITGIVRIKERLLSIIDFEKIIFDISPESGIDVQEIKAMGERSKNDQTVLIAEDSMLLRKLIVQSLDMAGYTSIIVCNDGQEAWDKLCELKGLEGDIRQRVSLVVTDIEMPQMDGHRLTKMIKADPDTKELPVIIFSSLIDDAMRYKGESVGADAQLSKPEIGNLVKIIDEMII